MAEFEKNIFVPPESIPPTEKHIIFLAGPIQGAPDWQNQAIKILSNIKPNIVIASPRRNNPINFDYNEQVNWETENLRKAGKDGVIMFWLAKEKEHVAERSYAQTSRAELFEWKVRHERDGSKIVIGIEEGFSGERYIRKRFSEDCPDVPILNSMENTCREVLRILDIRSKD